MKTLRPQHTYVGDLCTAVTGPVGDVYTATLQDGQIVEVTDGSVAVLVGDFVYYHPGDPDNAVPAEPTYLHATAADYALWML
jgi:hypothetical protein